MEQPAIISAHALTKQYRNVVAVNGVSFTVRQGECFGFLGPNGAGKTTLMKMITCSSPVTTGELWVDRKSVARDTRVIKSRIGVVSQADSLDPDLTVIQNLLAFCRFFNLPRETARRRAWEALDLFHLREKAQVRIEELSGGMRRRLLIARALLHQPTILVLDEPTTGLDPQTRHLVWEKIRALLSEGITILLTTHYMEEATALCNRLVVMDTGRIVVEGTPQALIHQHVGNQVIEIQVRQAEKARLIDRLRPYGCEVEDRGDSLCLSTHNGGRLPEEEELDGYPSVRRPGNLEDVFLRLTGRSLREE